MERYEEIIKEYECKKPYVENYEVDSLINGYKDKIEEVEELKKKYSYKEYNDRRVELISNHIKESFDELAYIYSLIIKELVGYKNNKDKMNLNDTQYHNLVDALEAKEAIVNHQIKTYKKAIKGIKMCEEMTSQIYEASKKKKLAMILFTVFFSVGGLFSIIGLFGKSLLPLLVFGLITLSFGLVFLVFYQIEKEKVNDYTEYIERINSSLGEIDKVEGEKQERDKMHERLNNIIIASLFIN